MYENLLPRFLRYVKTEHAQDATSTTTPSTQTQVAFAQTLKKELEEFRDERCYFITKQMVL